MYIGFHVKCLLLLSYVNETWLFSTDFRKILTQKFNNNPSSGSWVAPCGRTDEQTNGRMDRQRNLMKLIIAFCNFAYTPKNPSVNAVERNNCCLFWDPQKRRSLYAKPGGIYSYHCAWRLHVLQNEIRWNAVRNIGCHNPENLLTRWKTLTITITPMK